MGGASATSAERSRGLPGLRVQLNREVLSGVQRMYSPRKREKGYRMGVGVLQPWHVIVILVIVLVIFGPGKLPMLGKAVGDTVRDFKKAVGADEPARST